MADDEVSVYDTEFGRQTFPTKDVFAHTFTTWGFVVYSKSVVTPDGVKYTVHLYYPNELHTNTHGGRYMLTQAEMAEMFLVYGKWKGWFLGAVSDMAANNDIVGKLDEIVMSFYSETINRARREWNSVLKTGEPAKAISKLDEAVKKAKEEQAKLKDQVEELRLVLGDESFFIKRAEERGIYDLKKMAMFTKRSRGMKRSELRIKISRMRENKQWLAKYDSPFHKTLLKARMMDRFGGSKRIEESRELMRISEEWGLAGNVKAKNLYEQLSIMRLTPYMFGATVYTAVQKAAVAARNFLVEAVLGSKAPDIVEKTKQNRKWRGYSTFPPLNETGEFARSLRYVVIREGRQ